MICGAKHRVQKRFLSVFGVMFSEDIFCWLVRRRCDVYEMSGRSWGSLVIYLQNDCR